jgi:threonine/homoserine/homoserine lactone efflux protein
MPSVPTLALFMVAVLGLLIVPGPAVMYIVTRSVDQGRRAGLVSVAGIGVGTLVHVTAAALGLSALLVSSALAFALVKYAGAAYLVYLGIRAMVARDPQQHASVALPQPLTHVFLQGVVVNVLNPKTALFFLAFLPQFIDPARGSVTAQVFLLGGMMVVLGMCSDGTYALLAGTAAQWMRRSGNFRHAQHYITGTIYIALGVTAAVAGHRAK